jgi:hypothetical protein
MVKFKFRINRSIYQGFRISYSRDDIVVALTERDSRVYFGKADIDALTSVIPEGLACRRSWPTTAGYTSKRGI